MQQNKYWFFIYSCWYRVLKSQWFPQMIRMSFTSPNKPLKITPMLMLLSDFGDAKRESNWPCVWNLWPHPLTPGYERIEDWVPENSDCTSLSWRAVISAERAASPERPSISPAARPSPLHLLTGCCWVLSFIINWSA